ncbi:hypothetical protein VNO77_03653 [Canavalia gladiata]|uniref:Uncharacterized protein n=1 Tax=Canavalia gladiata TaxID=3824 RepID=A0AAN9N1I3_CANGL
MKIQQNETQGIKTVIELRKTRGRAWCKLGQVLTAHALAHRGIHLISLGEVQWASLRYEAFSSQFDWFPSWLGSPLKEGVLGNLILSSAYQDSRIEYLMAMNSIQSATTSRNVLDPVKLTSFRDLWVCYAWPSSHNVMGSAGLGNMGGCLKDGENKWCMDTILLQRNPFIRQVHCNQFKELIEARRSTPLFLPSATVDRASGNSVYRLHLAQTWSPWSSTRVDELPNAPSAYHPRPYANGGSYFIERTHGFMAAMFATLARLN